MTAGRHLSREELAVVRFVADAVGAGALRAQAERAVVVGVRDHGGIWVDVEVSPAGASRHASLTGRLPPDGQMVTVLDEQGRARGGVLIWLEEGLMTAIEIYDWTDDEHVPLPHADSLRFEAAGGGS